jgi:hypothetical protein
MGSDLFSPSSLFSLSTYHPFIPSHPNPHTRCIARSFLLLPEFSLPPLCHLISFVSSSCTPTWFRQRVFLLFAWMSCTTEFTIPHRLVCKGSDYLSKSLSQVLLRRTVPLEFRRADANHDASWRRGRRNISEDGEILLRDRKKVAR